MSDILFWVAPAVALMAATAWLARPLLRRGAVEMAESEQALSIYRDQVAELRRDAAEGRIDPDASEEAEREIALRTARAARDAEAGLIVSRRQRGLAVATAGVVGAATIGLYFFFGAPGEPDQPLTARLAAVEKLVADANEIAPREQDDASEATPAEDSFEHWWTVANQASASGDYATAADAYRRAAALSGDAPAVVSAYAEALTLANGNKVPPPARLAFEQVLAREPSEPRVRYYVALAKAQAQDFRGALADWSSLLADSAPDAPWTPLVRRDIANMERFLAQGGETELAASSVAGAAPEEADDWRAAISRARRLVEQGDPEGAREALAAAETAYSGAPFVRQQLAAARSELGLSDAPRGPSDQDVAAAASMSAEEQAEMIRGMVDGLAARLAEAPEDLEGWLMLIRSYAVLQDRDAATEAAQSALAAFPEAPDARKKLLTLAAQFALSVE